MNTEEIVKITVAVLAAMKPQPQSTACDTGPSAESQFWALGHNYFIRTVTHHHTGILQAVGPQEIILTKAAWIADDGRLTNALAKSEFQEVEMFPADKLVLIGRASIIDAVEIDTIPVSQK